jgi:L-ascorbate metabolism protein UlaG (beta-lactamase superfamily)
MTARRWARSISALALGLFTMGSAEPPGSACKQAPLPATDYRRFELPPAPAAFTEGEVRVQFMAVSTLLLDDGDTKLLIDGFFSRPTWRQLLFSRIAPDPEAIESALARMETSGLAAILVAHSHHDHAMDVADVAHRTKATVFGSPSTGAIVQGRNLPGVKFEPLETGRPMTFGDFTVTAYLGRHSSPVFAPGRINQPLKPPVYFNRYREGGSYIFLVTHRDRNILINPSAHPETSPQGLKADVVLLGIGGMGRWNTTEVSRYWEAFVGQTGAAAVSPIHWDDFASPLDQLRPMPRPLDNPRLGLHRTRCLAQGAGVNFFMMPVGRPASLPLSAP